MSASLKRSLLVVSVMLVAALLLSACQQAGGDDLLAEVKSRGVLRVSTDPNYEPQSFLNPDGTFEGFDIDTANEIGRRLGVTVEFVTPDWDVITAGGWGNQWDLSVGSMTITTKRAENLNFTEGYYFTPAQFAARAGAGIDSIDDIAGKTVCVGTETTYELYLSGEDIGIPAADIYVQPPANVTVVPLPTDQECAQSIEAGRPEFDIYLTSGTVVDSNIANGLPVVKVGGTVFLEKLAAATDKAAGKDSKSLADEVTRIINEMHADGFLRNTSMTWFGEDLTKR
jgi:polar amino acid transport system substrate-binding protein